MNAWWQMWQGGFTKELCQQIIADGSKLPPVEGSIGHCNVPIIDKGFRRSTIRWIPRSWDWLRKELEFYFQTANINAFGFDLSVLREIQFTEYNCEQTGHYDWHEDLTWTNPKPYHRKLSLVVQLSDSEDYEGCNLELEREPPKQEELRTKGTIIVFPGFMKHRVSLITKGTRYSLVAWYEGPKFR